MLARPSAMVPVPRQDRLTNVPVGEIDKHNERLAAGIERVGPLKLPPARKWRAVDEQPSDGLDRVCDDESCRHNQYVLGRRGGVDGTGTSSVGGAYPQQQRANTDTTSDRS